jgi:hypothetical protein
MHHYNRCDRNKDTTSVPALPFVITVVAVATRSIVLREKTTARSSPQSPHGRVAQR